MAKKSAKKALAAKAKTAKSVVPVRSEGNKAIAPFEHAFDRLLDRLFDDFRRWPSIWGRGNENLLRMPPTDVYEEKDRIVVKAELPGMGKEDIHVTLTDHTLTIKGEKKKEAEVKQENYHRWERSYGSLLRTVELPMAVKSDDVKAEFKDGVLTVRLPKSEEEKHKQVHVRID